MAVDCTSATVGCSIAALRRVHFWQTGRKRERKIEREREKERERERERVSPTESHCCCWSIGIGSRSLHLLRSALRGELLSARCCMRVFPQHQCLCCVCVCVPVFGLQTVRWQCFNTSQLVSIYFDQTYWAVLTQFTKRQFKHLQWLLVPF